MGDEWETLYSQRSSPSLVIELSTRAARLYSYISISKGSTPRVNPHEADQIRSSQMGFGKCLYVEERKRRQVLVCSGGCNLHLVRILSQPPHFNDPTALCAVASYCTALRSLLPMNLIIVLRLVSKHLR